MSAYEELEKRFHRIAALEEAIGLLHWDMAVLMPSGGATSRTEQLTALTMTIHELKTKADMANLLRLAETEIGGDKWKVANVKEMRRNWVHADAVEGKLVNEMTRACAECELAWRVARKQNDFQLVLPSLQVVLDLVREVAAAKASALGCSSYEALLDQYEPGANIVKVDSIFTELSECLPDLLEDALARQQQRSVALPLKGPFPVSKQRALAKKLIACIGFDFSAGRLDESTHPFCGGVPGDIRITTRYSKKDFTKSLMGVLHETGHALYEMGRPSRWRYQPVGEARGMVLHESQSLLIEMQVCRSKEFLNYVAPLFRETFDGEGLAWTTDNIHRLYTMVNPGFIRVDADEITYPSHVLIRYNLEKAMIEGSLTPRELPNAWNDSMEKILGIRPGEDRLGCLQDIHWYDGAWGYFPTYTLGALAAAQLYRAALSEIPEILEGINKGDFALLREWIGKNVHEKACLGTTDELLEAATGRPLNAEDYKLHLKARYT